MNVILRHAFTGFFFGGRHCWVNGRARAVDLGTIERAVETGLDERFGQMEVIVAPDDPQCQLVLPLRCKETNRSGVVFSIVRPVRGLAVPSRKARVISR
jgi:hypothetical protein